MTTPGIRIEGLDTLQKLFPTLQKQILSELKKGIAASAIMVQNEAKDSMRKAKHGKKYKRKSVEHVASAPGEPPAVDTGRLIGSVNHNITEDGLTALIGILDLSNVRYGKFLEYGTGRIAARPWLFPALEKNRANIEKRIQLGIQKALSVNGGA